MLTLWIRKPPSTSTRSGPDGSCDITWGRVEGAGRGGGWVGWRDTGPTGGCTEGICVSGLGTSLTKI